ncbi:hypothetical protein ACFL1B_04015 [Nanoarchaeota archaeon]
MAETSLERRLKKSSTRKTIDYLLPLVHKYDAIGESKLLRRDREVMATGIGLDQIAEYTTASKQKHGFLLTMGRVADTADRFLSLGGMVFEMLMTMSGVAPAFIANVMEETYEMTPKFFFLGYLAKEREWGEFWRLVGIEAATFGVPVAGDVYDAGVNRYIQSANTIIRENAKQNILADHYKR